MRGTEGILQRSATSANSKRKAQGKINDALSAPQHLSVPRPQRVHNRDEVVPSLPLGRRHKRQEFVDVDDGPPAHVVRHVEVPHTDFTEVTRMVLIEVRSKWARQCASIERT